MKNVMIAASLATAAVLAHAEPNAAKKELINKVLQLQQSSVDGMARMIAEQPAMQLMQQAGPAIRFQVAPEKREALSKDINGDVKKYLDEAIPLLQERANKVAPTTVGAVLDDKFTEEELRQLIAIIESPVQRKYAQLAGEIQKSLSDKLVADTRAQIEPKAKAMQQSITKRLDAAMKPSALK